VNNGVRELSQWINSHSRWLVLTGAGCSTAAGLGDYRDRDGAWKRPQPITGQSFIQDSVARQRYWARSAIGWPPFSKARSTLCHHALAQLQNINIAPSLITQNVDQLHQQAGHKNVIDLHGLLSELVCLQCGEISDRNSMQIRLIELNPWLSELDARFAPDGDADLELSTVNQVQIPNCTQCDGLLKPNVVFFGENVPTERVSAAFKALDEADGLLVVGSSLMVYSGFRFCRHAVKTNKPIVIVNDGVTRADDLASFKIEGDCGEQMNALVQTLL